MDVGASIATTTMDVCTSTITRVRALGSEMPSFRRKGVNSIFVKSIFSLRFWHDEVPEFSRSGGAWELIGHDFTVSALGING